MPSNPKNSPKKPKKPAKYITERIKIEKLIPGGQALATLENGKKAFLWNALPGETITSARITKSKSSYITAIAETIEQPSPHRIAPADACYLSTSPWQIMDYDYELAQKSQILHECFRQQGIDLPEPSAPAIVPAPNIPTTPATTPDPNTPATATSDPNTPTTHPTDPLILPIQTDGRELGYRNKMEYALYYSHDDEQIHLAFRGRGSHLKLIVKHSSLERPEIWDRAEEIVAELNRRHADARNYQSLLLRASQNGQVSGGLFENHRPHPIFPNLTDVILGETYAYSPNGFFQINLPVYELALREIATHIHTNKVLDLYSGVGTIGLSVARDCDLTLVECDHSAFRELEHNVNLIQKSTPTAHLNPILAKSEDALDYIAPDQTVILDPPRAGCAPTLIIKLLEVKPEAIIYLSCNPITQARDTQLLLEHYHIEKVIPYNFFPRTPHLENLLILKRN